MQTENKHNTELGLENGLLTDARRLAKDLSLRSPGETEQQYLQRAERQKEALNAYLKAVGGDYLNQI